MDFPGNNSMTLSAESVRRMIEQELNAGRTGGEEDVRVLRLSWNAGALVVDFTTDRDPVQATVAQELKTIRNVIAPEDRPDFGAELSPEHEVHADASLD